MIHAKDEPAFASLAEDFVKESSMGGNRAEQAYSAHDFSLILNRYVNLKQIIFYTHGDVGYVHLDGGGVSESTAAGLLSAPHNDLFAGPGRVLFAGCNVGEGKKGRDFLAAAGKALLRGHGGIVGGSTSKNLFGRWGLFDVTKPFWGDLRLLQLDAAGKVVAEKLF